MKSINFVAIRNLILRRCDQKRIYLNSDNAVRYTGIIAWRIFSSVGKRGIKPWFSCIVIIVGMSYP